MVSVTNTYSKKKPILVRQSSTEELRCNDVQEKQPVVGSGVGKTVRIESTINSVDDRLKRMSIAVAEAKDSLRRHRKSFFADRPDGSKAGIGIDDLEQLQTDISARFTFSDWLEKMLRNNWAFHKLSESTFSEVFLAVKSDGQRMVIKIMPLEREQPSTDACESEQQTPVPVPLAAAFHEISALIAIRDRIKQVNRYSVPSGWTGFTNIIEYKAFLIVSRFSIVEGSFPEPLLDCWKQWSLNNKSYNMDPRDIKTNKFAILCMEYGGKSLEGCWKELSLEQLCSVIKQAIISLSVLERELLFEHRDLYFLLAQVKMC